MKILMITIGYPPHKVGGTETYVLGLIEELKRRGFESYVAYLDVFTESDGPELRVEKELYSGTLVYRIFINRFYHKAEFVSFDANMQSMIIVQFRKVVDAIDPAVVHVHPL